MKKKVRNKIEKRAKKYVEMVASECKTDIEFANVVAATVILAMLATTTEPEDIIHNILHSIATANKEGILNIEGFEIHEIDIENGGTSLH